MVKQPSAAVPKPDEDQISKSLDELLCAAEADDDTNPLVQAIDEMLVRAAAELRSIEKTDQDQSKE